MALAGIGADLEGIHAVRAALDAGRVRTVTAERSRATSGEIAAIVADAHAQRITVTLVDDVRPMAVTGAPQGIIASATPIRPRSIDDIVEESAKPALVVLDHVEDPRNVGAVARSAVASGMSALVVAKRRAAPLGATAFKAAVGALERIPIVEVSSIANALERLERRGVWRVGLDGTSDRSLFGLEILGEPVALCVGAEGKGLSHLVAQRCDVLAAIPMVGDAESLNASVASAIGCFEIARVRGSVS